MTPEAAENVILPAFGGGPNAHAAGTDDATGSNNWAFAGSRTAAGKPILCGDPHQPFWVPSSWYQFALHGPEDNAAGCGHPGLPGLCWGSNGVAAWALTNNVGSTRDLYCEEVDPKDPGRYRDGDQWRPFATREVSIPVRGEAARSLTIRSSVRGPVVNGLVPRLEAAGDPPLALRWVGMEHLDDLRALVGLSRGANMASIPCKSQGLGGADLQLGIRRCHWGNRLPDGRAHPSARPDHCRVSRRQQSGRPLERVYPLRGNAHAQQPARGYVASANQRPVRAADPRPIYGAYSQGHRGMRMDEVFATGTWDRDANIRFQTMSPAPGRSGLPRASCAILPAMPIPTSRRSARP